MTRTVHASVVATGEFGSRVRDALAALPGTTVEAAADVGEAFRSVTADIVVVVLSRPDPSVCEAADAHAVSTGGKWLPIVMDGLTVRIGPSVTGGRSPCFECFRRRQIQHDTQKHISAILTRPGTTGHAFGAQGFLPHHVRMAASVAVAIMKDPGATGEVVSIDLHGGGLVKHKVIECDDCRFCGRPPDRSVSALRLTVASALGHRSDTVMGTRT
ncbi:TOMM precursor leader peptide-binding protein [Streptosporangium amethystogenes]|uniref:TOMM precursor leader peptide-binding protein n=1 Tax=Streptosporangium amethystogenes TaxID=2002 RepID=UPI0004C8BD6A|nr:TOMM precursor leader peptide-binding protein [Streptosporangium amethystogenes]